MATSSSALHPSPLILQGGRLVFRDAPQAVVETHRPVGLGVIVVGVLLAFLWRA